MLEVLSSLFDTTGFPPRKLCGTGWTQSLIALHVLSDLFIWLAYVSIPLVLFYFTRRRDLPFPRLFLLFALFILACGTTHLIEALIFEYPIYRFAGAMKLVTAVVSWATVIALIAVIPRVMHAVAEANKTGAQTALHQPRAGADRSGRARDYIIAVLAGVLAVLIRAAVDPILQDDNIFVVALLAVVYVSWQCGFRPAVACLLVGLGGYTFFFLPPRGSFQVDGLGNQLAVALFFFCGVACAALGESQRTAQRHARAALATAVARREELESELVRRRVVEAALRQREADLVVAQRETAEALARLNSFLDNAPLGIAFLDSELRYVRVNPHMAAANGRPVGAHAGHGLSQVHPFVPPDVLDRFRQTAGPNGKPFTAQLRHPDPVRPGEQRVSQVTVFPVRDAAGHNSGAGVVAQDVTDRLRAEDELRRSESNLADFFENANVGLNWVDPDGIILRTNTAQLELLGYARDEYVGRRLGAMHDDPAVTRDLLARLKKGERLDNFPARLRCKDGSARDVLISSSGLWEDGRFVHSRCFIRDVTELKRTTDELANQARVAALRADVAAALASTDETRAALRACAETLVRGIGAAFARVWTIDPSGGWLELQASAGMYTHTNGPHSRVRVGEYKIGRIAKTRSAHLTNDVPNDPNVSDPAWAARAGMRAFAGYPLVVEERLLGVVALFSRTELSDALLADLGLIAAHIAQYVDRRRATEALRESEAFRRSVFENSPDSLMIIDTDGRIREINAAGCRLMDLDGPEAVLDAPWETLWPVGARATVREAVAAGRAGRTVRFQGFCPTATGAPKYWDVSVAPLPGADGVPSRLIGVSRDVTDQRRAEDAVRASERRFRTLTEAVPQMVWTADPAGAVTFVNRRWAEYTGTSVAPDHADGWGGGAVHAADADPFRAAWARAVAVPADGFAREVRLRRADGEYRWMLAVAVPLRDATGAVSEWVGTLTDIDDQKRQTDLLARLVRERTAELERSNAALTDQIEVRKAAEERIRAIAAELQRSNGELEKFAYIASHDLQEPLRKIQAFGDRLRTKCRDLLPDNGKEFVDRMLAAAGRMRKLIDDLLTFSRITTQQRPFVRVDLDKLVREVVSDLDVRIGQEQGSVAVAGLVPVEADASQMRQLFQNLIVNAVKFHRPGVPPVVEIAGEPVPPDAAAADGAAGDPVPMCRVTVRDNGIGFEDKYRDRIFDVFQRLHGRNEYEGTGVGLAICRKIVERHGGTITAHGRVGEGATFVVALPVRQLHTHTREATVEDDYAEQTGHDPDGRR